MKKISRKINYFQITPTYFPNKSQDQFFEFVEAILELNKQKSADRFHRTVDKLLYLSSLTTKENEQLIFGKIHAIRMDAFPELFNTDSDEFKDLITDPKDGIVETSHFIISCKKDILLSFEFNQFGPRINDLVLFLNKIGLRTKVFEQIQHLPFVKDDLNSYKKRIGKISQIVAKVHKDNIKRVHMYSNGMFEALQAASEVSDAEIITCVLKYDYKKLIHTEKGTSMIRHFIDLIARGKTNPFDMLKVRAEDSENNSSLKDFDILNIWLKSTIKVEQKEKSRSLVSLDVFQKMREEFSKEFPL